jgi:hypothetical protein
MYIIIGADRKEYGPASAEQVREWIEEGRANGETRIREAESATWRNLSELPEFAPALAAKHAPDAPPPPRVAAAEADALAVQILARDYQVKIGRCISRGWQLVQDHFWPAVGASALVTLVQVALGCVPILGPVAYLLLGGVLIGGLYYFFLKLARRRPAEIGDAFAGFRIAFVPLMLAGLVSHLLTAVGLVLCILPGIYLGVAWAFTLLLVVDKGLEFWPAMELSRKVVTKHWWTVFGLLLVNFLILLAGVLACGVGVFVAVPVMCGSLVHAYEEIFAAPAAQPGGPPTA